MPKGQVDAALQTVWLILAKTTLAISAIRTVLQHLILFLKDKGYSAGCASTVLSSTVLSILAGRVVVGYLTDRYRKTVRALFYFIDGYVYSLAIFGSQPVGDLEPSVLSGFGMGAGYMLIPIVTAESFGLEELGKLLANDRDLFYRIMSWACAGGKIFDTCHSYDLAWVVPMAAGIIGAASANAIHQA